MDKCFSAHTNKQMHTLAINNPQVTYTAIGHHYTNLYTYKHIHMYIHTQYTHAIKGSSVHQLNIEYWATATVRLYGKGMCKATIRHHQIHLYKKGAKPATITTIITTTTTYKVIECCINAFACVLRQQQRQRVDMYLCK